MEEIMQMNDEEAEVIMLGLEYIESHSEEFPDVEITHF